MVEILTSEFPGARFAQHVDLGIVQSTRWTGRCREEVWDKVATEKDWKGVQRTLQVRCGRSHSRTSLHPSHDSRVTCSCAGNTQSDFEMFERLRSELDRAGAAHSDATTYATDIGSWGTVARIDVMRARRRAMHDRVVAAAESVAADHRTGMAHSHTARARRQLVNPCASTDAVVASFAPFLDPYSIDLAADADAVLRARAHGVMEELAAQREKYKNNPSGV